MHDSTNLVLIDLKAVANYIKIFSNNAYVTLGWESGADFTKWCTMSGFWITQSLGLQTIEANGELLENRLGISILMN